MLKCDIKKYFWQFTKTLSICYQWNTTPVNLGICSWIWLEQLSDFPKHIKLFKIQGTTCYNINVTHISLPKGNLQNFIRFKFLPGFNFSCIWKKDVKVFGKNTVTFYHNIAYMVNSFVIYDIWQLRLITYKNYSKFCRRKWVLYYRAN